MYIYFPDFRFAVDDLMHVLSVCDIDSLLRCAQTCSMLRAAVAAEIRFRLVALLRPFFGERVPHWKGLLRLHGAIMSGSVALALFASPADWEPGDLDVYVASQSYHSFIIDFERLFPVVLEADMTRRYPGNYTEIKRVRRYITSTGKRLEIIQSRSTSAVSPLLYFWSSVVVNFITPRGAVCAFPKHTLSRLGLVTNDIPKKAVCAKKKYQDRGFKFAEVDSWRSHPAQEPDRGCSFSYGPLLVLDFHSVWSNEPIPLPIYRLGSRWKFIWPPTGPVREQWLFLSRLLCSHLTTYLDLALPSGYSIDALSVPSASPRSS